MSSRRYLKDGSLILGLVFSLGIAGALFLFKPTTPPAELQGVLRADYKQLEPFELKVHQQGSFNQAHLQEKWSLLFFGYLSCPDICPNTLYQLKQFYSLLTDESAYKSEEVQVIFVSVDPARDNIEALANYTQHFHQRFVGATADKATIDSFTGQFGAGYVIEPELSPGEYQVAHTSAIFLIDPHSRIVASFSQPHYATMLHAQFQMITEYFAGNG